MGIVFQYYRPVNKLFIKSYGNYELKYILSINIRYIL